MAGTALTPEPGAGIGIGHLVCFVKGQLGHYFNGFVFAGVNRKGLFQIASLGFVHRVREPLAKQKDEKGAAKGAKRLGIDHRIEHVASHAAVQEFGRVYPLPLGKFKR
jgi:hypothetical protein